MRDQLVRKHLPSELALYRVSWDPPPVRVQSLDSRPDLGVVLARPGAARHEPTRMTRPDQAG
jgi:hypothetical protein